jgi:Sulfotransferase domain
MTLKVIGTGFGRTGTDSMREALDILGFGPCHHMREVMQNEEQKTLWRGLAKGAAPDWDRLFAGYGACVDWPSAHYWPELIQAYPNARVLLTWRTADSWWTSFEQTIAAAIENLDDPDALGRSLVRDKVFAGDTRNRAHAIAVYEANVARVKATVPRDRLLIDRLGDGWEPLCAHLGVDVPDRPFPRSNSAQEFRDRMAQSEHSN